MRSLTVEDTISINIHIKQVLGDYFIFDVQTFDYKITLFIKGKNGSIPDDIAEQIINELNEFHYESHTVDMVGFGQSVIVIGRGD